MKNALKTDKPTRAHLNRIVEWCRVKYGRSKCNGPYPVITFRKSCYLTEGICGEYNWEDNTIFLSKEHNPTLIDLINTVIHEWTHYLQPLRSHIRTMYRQGKAAALFTEQDPLENQAREIADRDTLLCYHELFS
jgi:hypothetical protein